MQLNNWHHFILCLYGNLKNNVFSDVFTAMLKFFLGEPDHAVLKFPIKVHFERNLFDILKLLNRHGCYFSGREQRISKRAGFRIFQKFLDSLNYEKAVCLKAPRFLVSKTILPCCIFLKERVLYLWHIYGTFTVIYNSMLNLQVSQRYVRF